MRIYPAIRMQAGGYIYYNIRMPMLEVANEIQIPNDERRTRDSRNTISTDADAQQGSGKISDDSSRQSDFFFRPIVAATEDGDPTWYPVEFDQDSTPGLLSKSAFLEDCFGFLVFEGSPRYHLLKGRNQLLEIESLVQHESLLESPRDFSQDMLSVVLLIREDMSDAEWNMSCKENELRADHYCLRQNGCCIEE